MFRARVWRFLFQDHKGRQEDWKSGFEIHQISYLFLNGVLGQINAQAEYPQGPSQPS